MTEMQYNKRAVVHTRTTYTTELSYSGTNFESNETTVLDSPETPLRLNLV